MSASGGILFLVNPASGNSATGKRWPELRRRAAELGLHGEEVLSEFPGHLAQAASEARDSLLVVVGGDGTVNEVVNGVAGAGAEIAVLPCGTGQDFGRTHGIPSRFDDAVRVALGDERRTIDLGRVELDDGTSRFFANVASAGMSGAVARRANGMTKALGGRVTFFYALTREFIRWQNTQVTVRLDEGVRREGPMHDVIVANGRYHAGGMKLAPEARQDDGLFDVVTIGDVTKLDFLTTAPKLYSGRYLAHPKVELVRSSFAAIDADVPLPIEVDGEPIGTTPARFEVVPAALRLRVPAA
ncbi:MAG: diacylglycerol kinase family lipid kinase [Actinobacteria bacterium]|nr:MAG: diacylglycerol kinase family lipid kinase [Actinomycetota bacterium]